MKRSWANRVARVFLLWVAFPLWGGEPENQLRSRLIWQGDAVNLWGSPSPDGKWLSFVDGSTGALALRNVQDGSTRPIPGASGGGTGEFAYFSTFDRTGGRIAFAWFNSNGHYELRVAAVDSADSRPGSTEVLFSNPEVRFVQPCAWSHDGERVLTLFFREDNTSQIALVDVVDRSVHVLRSLPWIYPKRMDLSPDGRYLVYDNLAEPDGSERDLYVMRTDGTQEWRLLDGPADDQSPVWAHNGDSIWFVSDRGGSQAIWRVGVHRGKAADAPQRLRGPLPRVLLIGATRSGDVFFGLRKGAAQLYSQDWGPSSGSVSSAAVPMYEEVLAGDRLLPVFAPDGEGIAFLAQVGTENQGRGSPSRCAAVNRERAKRAVVNSTRLRAGNALCAGWRIAAALRERSPGALGTVPPRPANGADTTLGTGRHPFRRGHPRLLQQLRQVRFSGRFWPAQRSSRLSREVLGRRRRTASDWIAS